MKRASRIFTAGCDGVVPKISVIRGLEKQVENDHGANWTYHQQRQKWKNEPPLAQMFGDSADEEEPGQPNVEKELMALIGQTGRSRRFRNAVAHHNRKQEERGNKQGKRQGECESQVTLQRRSGGTASAANRVTASSSVITF